MKSHAPIVCNGGWITCEVSVRPRARFCGNLSAWWTGFSAIASLPFWEGWSQPLTPLHWICAAAMLPLPVLLIATLVFRLTESPRVLSEEAANSDYNPRNLY